MDKKTKRTIATTLVVGGTLAAASGIVAANALVSEMRINKEADAAIRKARGFVAEMTIDKNSEVRESAKKGLAYINKILGRG